MDKAQLTAELKHESRRLGFALAGVCPAVAPPGISRFRAWLEAGYGGDMHYLAERQPAYEHPHSVLEGARSIVMLAMNYQTKEPRAAENGQGRVSRYAWGARDYHDVIHKRLKELVAFCVEQIPDANVRGVVDTAPLLEREFAQLAGLGWTGKNTLLLNQSMGSWFFLAALLTDQELEYDTAHETDHCGSCRACLDACPTDAFPQPYVLDATKCISYLTIELRAAMPAELRHGVGEWLFGCDICQDVCPWNNHAPRSDETGFEPMPEQNPIQIAELFSLSDEAFRDRFRKTPLWRPKRRGILRNAAIVLGNQRSVASVPALTQGLQDQDPVVRGACAWALGQIDTPESRLTLDRRLAVEQVAEVAAEIQSALEISA
jgi:epoxyqueuosine reductase